MARNDPEAASREFRTALALGPVDQAAAHTDLAESYFKSGQREEAKKEIAARRSKSRRATSARRPAVAALGASAMTLKVRLEADTTDAGADHERTDGEEIGSVPLQPDRRVIGRCSCGVAPHAAAHVAASRGSAAAERARQSLRRPAVALRAHPVPLHHRRTNRRRLRRASRGTSTRRPPNRTCRDASRPPPQSTSRILLS